nr:hypothetical protein [uncultured Roseobacter sp.]
MLKQKIQAPACLAGDDVLSKDACAELNDICAARLKALIEAESVIPRAADQDIVVVKSIQLVVAVSTVIAAERIIPAQSVQDPSAAVPSRISSFSVPLIITSHSSIHRL